MGVSKWIGRNEGLRRALCWLGSLYIRLVGATGRWEIENAATASQMWDEGRPFILAFWHGRILMMPRIWRRGQPIHMLISQHRDGQLIARTVAHFGIETVTGSTSRGGGAALRAMVKALRAGTCVGITPDGPRGPRMRSSEGIVALARLSGCPILPATFSARRGRLLGSWDRFFLAAPFGGGVFVWGDPIKVAPDADAQALESARQAVEDSLTRITRAADARTGQTTPEPAGTAR